MENSIPSGGHSFAARAAAAGLTPTARLREEWAGMSQIRLIQAAAALDQKGLAELAEKFARIGRCLFHQERLSAAVTVV